MNTTVKDKGFQIGTLARRTGVSVDTIRYYERGGLLAPAPRKGAVHHRGYRLYGEEAVVRLRFIRRAKELGFTLEEIGELLAIQDASPEACGETSVRVRAKLADVDQRVADLRRMRRALAKWADACARGDHRGPCPLLASLSGKEPSDQ
jgi:MerR family copper efflux transcriptional regulator